MLFRSLDLSNDVRFTASYTHNQGRAELPRPNLVSEALNNRNEEIAYAKLDIDFSERLSLFVKGYWHDWDSSYSQTNTTPGGGRVVVSDKEIWRFDPKVRGELALQHLTCRGLSYQPAPDAMAAAGAGFDRLSDAARFRLSAVHERAGELYLTCDALRRQPVVI